MASLLDSGWQAEVDAAMLTVFDTFKRLDKVTFYKTPTEVVISTDPNYIADLQKYDENDNIEYTIDSQEFECRIIFLGYKPSTASNFPGDANTQVKAEQNFGQVKIQMKEDAFAFLGDTERFTIDGVPYMKSTDYQKLGVLGTFQFYQILLQKVN